MRIPKAQLAEATQFLNQDRQQFAKLLICLLRAEFQTLDCVEDQDYRRTAGQIHRMTIQEATDWQEVMTRA